MKSESEMLDEIPQIGEVIADKYRLEQVLGIGGMGVVCQASHVHLGEKFAIKFLTGEAAQSEERVTRFIREAWAAAKIKSDHIARVVDVGRRDDGVAYMVMEFLEGEDVEQVLQRGPLAVHEAIDFTLQACEALAEAHKLAIVHRDLKPGNLFVTTRADGLPWIKVLDFGISKVAGGALTNTSTLMGSPLYMSPEQLTSSKHVDSRADIWALGVILYEMVSGTTPFVADTLPQIVAAVMNTAPRPLEGVCSGLPPELAQALYRCLEKDPTRRFQSLAELATVLAPFGSRSAQASAEYIANVASRDPNAPRAPLGSQATLQQLPHNPTVASQPQLDTQLAHGPSPAHTQPGHAAPPAPAMPSAPGIAPTMQQPGIGASTHEPLLAVPTERKGAPVALVALGALGVVALIAVVALMAGGDAETSAAAAAADSAVADEQQPPTGTTATEMAGSAPTAASTAVASATASADASATASASASQAPSTKKPGPPPGKLPPKKWDPWEGR